jgi:hypothetical protein
MPRMRTLKPETFTSETLSLLPVHARWTFAGLWTYADDSGRGKADPRLIKAAIWPLDDDVTAQDVAAHLDQMEELGLLCRYTHMNRQFLHIVNFGEHQKPNRPVPSKLPECTRTTHGGLSEDSVSPHGGLKPKSFTDTPTTPPLRTEVEGDVDGEGDVEDDSLPGSAPQTPDDPEELREDVERLCKHLADRIEGNGSKRPTIGKKWRDAARLLMDKDGRTEAQVRAAIDWCQNDEFWKSNVMSMSTLREQYDRLRLQAEQQRNARASPNGKKPPRPDIDKRDEWKFSR